MICRSGRAFLKIEDGCQNFCSYCIIPYARGPVKSRHLDKIHAEAVKLVAAGFKEIVLTGIHLGAYGGRDLAEEVTLADACREVLKAEGPKRLRLGSLESIERRRISELIRSDERFCAHLHSPLQAGSDAVLKDMNRHYDTRICAPHRARGVGGARYGDDGYYRWLPGGDRR